MRRLDPRFGNVIIDANALDADGRDRTNVDRLPRLKDEGAICVIAPWGVRAETQNPNSPADVTRDNGLQIFSIQTGRTSEEQVMQAKIRAVLQGNAQPGKHDADAEHVFEAQKYGGRYFITHDVRINQKKRKELERLIPDLGIVTLEEFLAIYDKLSAKG